MAKKKKSKFMVIIISKEEWKERNRIRRIHKGFIYIFKDYISNMKRNIGKISRFKKVVVIQLCLTLCDPMNYRTPGLKKLVMVTQFFYVILYTVKTIGENHIVIICSISVA